MAYPSFLKAGKGVVHSTGSAAGWSPDVDAPVAPAIGLRHPIEKFVPWSCLQYFRPLPMALTVNHSQIHLQLER